MPSRSVLPLLFLSLASAAAQNPDPYAKSGNPAPQATPLAAEQETALLKDVKVADGFDVTLFAAPPMVNYPVFVTAAPDGTLYVSSDGNGSLGRDPGRGRVIRLRDTDGDGHADETRVFCEVDAPRGLVWDRDRLYLVHPPHLSEYIDADGDGVAEKENILVKNIAFGYEDRPADHTTNGLTLGIDGWLYIAGGDFGFMDAEGSDGRHLQHRGGGVIRVRPDGTGLELFCTGTRNILEVAISPTMDVFARDNTNDGGGWNVRFHHLLPLTNQGYPRLFKNFPNECIQPLADYGGGSGCGAVFIDEPGFGEWNHAPFTCDWGTGALWHHQVRPKGATFEETRDPLPLVRMTRPTDADVDAMGHLYVASWKGATFKWEGPDVGYIVRVTPKGSSAEALPDFDSLKDSELRGQLQSPSFRRRLAAMQTLRQRNSPIVAEHLQQIDDHQTDELRLATSFPERASDDEVIAAISHADPVVAHAAIHAAAVRKLDRHLFSALDEGQGHPSGPLRALQLLHTPGVVGGLIDRLGKTSNSELRRGILAALCRLHFQEGAWKGDSWGTRPDTRGPYYQPEPWDETERIAAVLKQALESSSPDEAAFLIQVMRLNRIQSDDALARVLALAQRDP
ncbi:MAG: heme-binding protein, partial [Verrucomicrobiales bacterium]|nr:heme-binding protein [Verrucomicrobiales bacterium]